MDWKNEQAISGAVDTNVFIRGEIRASQWGPRVYNVICIKHELRYMTNLICNDVNKDR